jgi:stage V sporulation protein G
MKTQEKSSSLPSLEVRAFPLTSSKNNLLAFASVTLGGCFAVNGVQIFNGKNGVFVSMPSTKDSKGEYRDVCFPITAEFRSVLHEAVLAEYARVTEKAAVSQ